MSISETEFLSWWQQSISFDLEPNEIAILAGVQADCLSWVFVSGYQAAIRWCFGDTPYFQQYKPIWSSLAVSEDKSEPNPLAGITIEESSKGITMNGSKTWVAAVNSIDHLIIQAGKRKNGSYWLVSRNQSGLTLIQNPVGKILPELSQGRATFENAPLKAAQQLDSSLVKYFPIAEASFLLLALASCLNSLASKAQQTDLADKADTLQQSLISHIEALTEPCAKESLASLHKQTTALLTEWIDTNHKDPNTNLWQRDLPVLQMYAPKI